MFSTFQFVSTDGENYTLAPTNQNRLWAMQWLYVLNGTIHKGDMKRVKLLLEKGADPNSKENQGKTALDIAKENEHADRVKYLERLK